MIFIGPDPRESAIVTAERHEQDMRPERRTTASIRAEADHDEHGGLGNPETYRVRNDLPEPADPWQHGQITCDRCSEIHEPHCTHGRQLCASCASFCCQTCECEDADAAARADEIRREWWN